VQADAPRDVFAPIRNAPARRIGQAQARARKVQEACDPPGRNDVAQPGEMDEGHVRSPGGT